MMLEARAISLLGRVDEGEALAGRCPPGRGSGESRRRAAGNRNHPGGPADAPPALRRRRKLSCAPPWCARAPCIRPYSEAGVQVNLGVDPPTATCATTKRFRTSKRRLRWPDRSLERFTPWRAATWPSAIRNSVSTTGRSKFTCRAWHKTNAPAPSFTCTTSLGETGHTYMMKGDPKAAIPYLERALSLASEANRTRDAAIWAGNLSECYSELRDWQNAATFNQEAIRLKTAAKVPTLYYNVLNAARIAARSRRFRGSHCACYQQAIDEGQNDPSVVWEAHAGLGDGSAPAASAGVCGAALRGGGHRSGEDPRGRGQRRTQTAVSDPANQPVSAVCRDPDRPGGQRSRPCRGRFQPRPSAGRPLGLGRRRAPAGRRLPRHRAAERRGPALLLAGSCTVSRVGGECARDPPRPTAAGGGDRTVW